MSPPVVNDQQSFNLPSISHPDLIIRNGFIVTTEQQFEKDIRIHNGKIVEIDYDLPKGNKDSREIDAHGLLLLPGGIDPHVHLTIPDTVSKDERWADDLTSGSKAALAGGITTIGNVSFAQLGETPLATLEREMKLVQKYAIADVMLHPVLLSPFKMSIEEFPRMTANGHTSIKIFMPMEDFDKHISSYLAVLRAAGDAGILTMIHCEDFAIVTAATETLIADGRGSLQFYAESRPVVSEVVATQRAVGICEATGSPIYIVHLSSQRALQVCEEAEERTLPVFVETRPIYLHLTKERYLQPDGALYVGQPPLREENDVAALWKGLAKGTIHTLGSDHAPWTKEQKLDPALDVANLRPGINNLQVMLPMLYSEGVLKGKLSQAQFVALTSTNAAKLFGLYPKKGTISVGSDADLVLWDPTKTRVLNAKDLFSHAGFSIYEGTEITGWPRMTIRRGQVVFEDNQIMAKAGSGQLLRRYRFKPYT